MLNSLIPPELANYSWAIIVLALWSIVWKGLALWKAARRGEKYWFVALLVINLVGLLEMLYIFVITPWMDSRKTNKTDESIS